MVDATGVLLPGDYNQDMTVDHDDFLTWRAAFGTTRISVHDPPLADGNYDGIVDAADYVIWRKHVGQTGFGAGAGSTLSESNVPEPTTLLMVALAIGLYYGPFCGCRIRTGFRE